MAKLHGKTVSKWAQIFAAVWIVGWTAFKFIKAPEGITIMDIVATGVSIPACFSPIFWSIHMDKKNGVIKNVIDQV